MSAPQVQADPIAIIVDLVARVESTMDRAAIKEVAVAVAGGRAKRRRLVQGLLDNPTVLIDGRSPALRGVGDLLIALRNAGATRVSRRGAPSAASRCAPCSAAARTGTAAPARHLSASAAPAAARWRSSLLGIGEIGLAASSAPTKTPGTR